MVFLQSFGMQFFPQVREQLKAARLHVIWISPDIYLFSQVEIRHPNMIETVTPQLPFQAAVLKQLRMIGAVIRHLPLQSAGVRIPKSLQLMKQSTMAYSNCSKLQATVALPL
ncbi:unnamed protein product [Dicrocoelium dendriticum]|nr:unnamed protein product [Dicrocoelium dendriticum]